MKYSDNEKCTILLTSYAGLQKFENVKPLSLGEWNKFLEKLVKAGLEPEVVFTDAEHALKDMGYTDSFVERVNRLVDRSAALAFALDDYERRGIHAVTMLNKDYPVLLRHVLKEKKPPVLFYAGELSLAKKVGIGVVGSRNVSTDGIEFTRTLVSRAVSENLVVYSGGARGVDTTSESVSLGMGGGVISYIADSLFSRVKKNINSLVDGKLLLFSDVKPDVGFSASRAMNRNKYIYGSAYGTFVAESDLGKGGTWSGATEALKKGWGKVFVYDRMDCAGNQKLIEGGGIPYLPDDRSIYDILMSAQGQQQEAKKEKVETADHVNAKDEENYEQMSLDDWCKLMS